MKTNSNLSNFIQVNSYNENAPHKGARACIGKADINRIWDFDEYCNIYLQSKINHSTPYIKVITKYDDIISQL